MATKNQYYCIFQTSSKIDVTSDTSNVLTYSKHVGCSGYCPLHADQSSKHQKYSEEGQKYIQQYCNGHRLQSISDRAYAFPIIKSDSYILANQFNTLATIIDTELTLRKKSKLYQNAQKKSKKTVDSTNNVLREQLQYLNDLISNEDFYKDIKCAPDVVALTKHAQHVETDYTIAAIRNMVQDCICYSDCNGYSMCQCYGYCNHY